jgi:hypothetical protein
MPATRAGTSASEEVLANSDRTSNWTPVTMKKTGTRKPNPIARNFPSYRSRLGRSSLSAMLSTIPATNAPSSASTPNSCAIAVKASKITKAPRMRSWEVDWSVASRVRRSQADCHSRRRPKAPSTAAAPRARTYATCAQVGSGWAENSTVSSSRAPNSPTEPAMITSWPNSASISPASRSTGTITPSELAVRARPSSRRSAPAAICRSPMATGTATTRLTRKLAPVSRKAGPRNALTSISWPARNSRKPNPSRYRT